MISIQKLNDQSFLINPDLIRSIESTPDTLLTFTNGEKMMVKNTPQEIVDRIVEYRRQIFEAQGASLG